ncbi:MAG: YbeD family protein [Pseudomonadales bacterium]
MSELPRIEFPCLDYPIKVIGHNVEDFRARVLSIVRVHAPEVSEAAVSVRDSRQGAFSSVRISIVATGEDQLRALHAALMAEPSVKLVL